MFLLFFCGFRPPPRSTLFPSRRSSDLLRDSMCTLFGGREAEALLLDDISIGSASDLDYASQIARSMVEQYGDGRSEEHTSELQSLAYLVCRLRLEKKKTALAC